MASIGETLREARMRRHLDISDVEERTKIRAKYLRALENEEFAMLPGATFVKTFLRTYAEVVGLDPHVLVEEYRATYEPRDETETQPIATAPADRAPRERRFSVAGGGGGGGGPGRGTILAGLGVGLLAVILVLGLTANDKGSKQAADTTPKTTPKKKKPTPRPKPKPAPVPALVTLQVTPNGPTYMCVDRGLGKAVIYNGTTTDPQTFKGRKLRLNLGRTAVAIKVNGKSFQVPQVANPVGYEFSPGGSKKLAQGQRPTCA
jgi:transcriptional regulator with XRE-family HTH domain